MDSNIIKVFSKYIKSLIDNEIKPELEEIKNLLNNNVENRISNTESFIDILTENGFQVERVDEKGEVVEVIYGTETDVKLKIVSVNTTDNETYGEQNGSISVNLQFGKPDYTYKLYYGETIFNNITKATTNHTFYNLPAGTYKIIVEDSDEPKTIKEYNNIEILQPELPNYQNMVKLWYDVDNVEGKTIVDKSGNGLNGQMMDNTTVINDYFYMDGSGDYILTPYAPNLNNKPTYSHSLWFYDDNRSDMNQYGMQLLGNYGDEIQTYTTHLIYDNKDDAPLKLETYERDTSGYNNYKPPVGSGYYVNLYNSKWHHIVRICNGDKQILYLDGEKVYETTQRASGFIGLSVYPFRVQGMLGRYNKCRMKDIRIWENYALTENEVLELYNLHK